MKNCSIQPISFKSTYTVDTNTAVSRNQLFTLGALMNNFWINGAGNTFNRVKSRGVYGKVDINVKDYKDKSFESVLKNNNISYKKKDNNINYSA